MSAASPRFVATPADFSWFVFDGGCALFHRPAGKTHFVNEPSHVLLTRVLQRPAAIDAAAATLAELQGRVPDESFAAEVGSLIRRLEELGLVRRC